MNIEAYLERFGYGKTMSLDEKRAEMDRVWDDCGLDNRRHMSGEALNKFYGHPIWILTGLFTNFDEVSLNHRKAIAKYIDRELSGKNSAGGRKLVADFGGGSGVLASQISAIAKAITRVDIIEPYPFEYFKKMNANNEAIRYCENFSKSHYDFVIAQDVLEHVNDPVNTAIQLADATKLGGLLLFANCFQPIIKCHLPSSFYLRHTFSWVMSGNGLDRAGVVEGAKHVQVFRKCSEIDRDGILQRNRIARAIGPTLNLLGKSPFLLRQINNIRRKSRDLGIV